MILRTSVLVAFLAFPLSAFADDFTGTVVGISDGDTTADGELTVQVVNGCLGVCDRAPICKLDADFFGDLTPEKLNQAIRGAIAAGGSWRDAHHPVPAGSSHDR